jgi:hypothetical protein
VKRLLAHLKRHFRRDLICSRVPAAKMPNRKRWGSGGKKNLPTRIPLRSRLRRNSALRGRTTGPERWLSLVQHLIELLRGRSAVPLRRFFSKEQGAGHPSSKDVSVLFTALARPYFGCRWLLRRAGQRIMCRRWDGLGGT